MIVIALVAGILGLIASFALRRDTERAKQFRETGGIVDERFILLSLPGFSLVLVGSGAAGLLAPAIGGWLGNFWGPLLLVVCAAAVLLGFYMSIIGMTKGRIPQVFLPAWLRNKR